MTDIFAQATRKALRFKTALGTLATEDLWNLGLPQLDHIAVALHKEIQDKEVSFIKKAVPDSENVQLKFDVVKYIIDTKVEEADALKARHEKDLRRRKLLEVLADQEDEALKSKSKEEILKELEELDK